MKVTGKLPASEPADDALTDPDSPDRLGQLRTVNPMTQTPVLLLRLDLMPIHIHKYTNDTKVYKCIQNAGRLESVRVKFTVKLT